MARRKWIGRGLLLAMIAGYPAATLADVLILRSVGPSAKRYPAGQRLPDSATFTLRPGDSVTVLRRTGTRVFRGPGTFSVAGPAVRTRFATPNGRAATGAVRGGPDTVPDDPSRRPPDIWHYDATTSGRACVLPGQPLVLWRPAFDKPVELAITPPAGAPLPLQWQAGQQVLPLTPSQAKPDAVVQYRFPGSVHPTRITLKVIDARSDDREAIAGELVKHRCYSQLDNFVRLNEEKAE